MNDLNVGDRAIGIDDAGRQRGLRPLISQTSSDPRFSTGQVWGPAILFAEPVSWPDPLIVHDPNLTIPKGRGYRMSIYGGIHRDEVRRKFTRGLCHAFAAASVRLHGGHLVALLNNSRGRMHVVHVLSAHPVDGGFEVRDVCGTHSVLRDTRDLEPEDFHDLSREHLLGTGVDLVRLAAPFPWVLPCDAPTEAEIREALSFRACHRPLPVADSGFHDHRLSFPSFKKAAHTGP